MLDEEEIPLENTRARIVSARKTMDKAERLLHRVALARGHRDVACPKCQIVFLAHNLPVGCDEVKDCPFKS